MRFLLATNIRICPNTQLNQGPFCYTFKYQILAEYEKDNALFIMLDNRAKLQWIYVTTKSDNYGRHY